MGHFIPPSAGNAGGFPIANTTGITILQNQHDTISGGNDLTVVEAGAAEQVMLAVRAPGKAFNTMALVAPGQLVFSDGTVDPYQNGSELGGDQHGFTFATELFNAALLVSDNQDSYIYGMQNKHLFLGYPSWDLVAVRSPFSTAPGRRTAGALPTVLFVSGIGAQVDTTADRQVSVPITYNPTGVATATCKVEISPDNVTYSTLSTETEPAVASLAGTVRSLSLMIPAGWWVRLTVTNALISAATYY